MFTKQQRATNREMKPLVRIKGGPRTVIQIQIAYTDDPSARSRITTNRLIFNYAAQDVVTSARKQSCAERGTPDNLTMNDDTMNDDTDDTMNDDKNKNPPDRSSARCPVDV